MSKRIQKAPALHFTFDRSLPYQTIQGKVIRNSYFDPYSMEKFSPYVYYSEQNVNEIYIFLQCAHCDHTTGRKAYISMHAQTAHGAPGTENDVVTLPEEEAKIQKLRDRLNEVYNPIITRPDEDGDEGGNDDEEGIGEESKDIDKTTYANNHENCENNQVNHNDTNQQSNTDVDMDTADDDDDIESEDIDTADSDMNDAAEDNKDKIKLSPVLNTSRNLNFQKNDTNMSTQSSLPSHYPLPTHPPPTTTVSNHSTSGNHTPMLGNHEMVATPSSNNLPIHSSLTPNLHGNTQLSHQPQLNLQQSVPTHDMQTSNNHHLLSSSHPHPQHPNILNPSLSTHNHNPQHSTSTNSIQSQMQSHHNTTNTHLLGGNLMRQPKEEDNNPLSSSMLDEFEQQMNQYQQQH